jgi:hypothetical protein
MRSRIIAAPLRAIVTALTIAAGMIVAVHPGDAAVKARVDFDKTFNFSQARTCRGTPMAPAR